MKDLTTIINDFVTDYDFETPADLKDKLTDIDIMENILDLSGRFDKLDTCDIDEAISIIDKLNEWKLLYSFITESL